MQSITAAAMAQAGPAQAGSTQASPAQPATPQPRLVRAAHEFEAQMMKELMKPLNHGASLTGADEDDSSSDSGSTGALGEFASEAMARAMSNAGGFGIASGIVKQLAPQSSSTPGNHHGTSPVTRNRASIP